METQIGYLVGDKFYVIKKIESTWTTYKERTHLARLLSYLKANRIVFMDTSNIMSSEDSYKGIVKEPKRITFKEAKRDNLEIIYVYYNDIDKHVDASDPIENPKSSFFNS